MRRVLLVLGLLLSVQAGCGGDDEAPIPIDDVPRELATAICGQARACVGELLDVFFGGIDCVTVYTNAFEDSELENLKAAIDAGRVVYDSDRARDCIAALEALSCEELTNPRPEACEDAFQGTVEEGGACGLDQECIGDAFCDRAAGMCPGTCTARRAAGGECADDGDCRTGLECSPATRRCVAPATDGMPCEGGSAPECQTGLVCVGQMAGTPGTCRRIDELFVGAVGEACDLTMGPWCREGLSCVVVSIGIGTADFECQAEVGSGDPCKAGVPDQCPDGEYCAGTNLVLGMIDGTCEPLPGTGEPCAVVFGPRCADGHVCVDGREVCLPVQRNGAPCMESQQCYSGNCVAGACVPNAMCEP